MVGATRRTHDAGMTVYSVFLGALVTVVLGLVTTTAFPVSDEVGATAEDQAVSLARTVLGLGLSLVVLAGGLFLPVRLSFLRLGLLLAAVANLVLSNVWAWGYEHDSVRLLAALASLALAVGAGLLQYNRRANVTAKTTELRSPETERASVSDSLEARISVLEGRLDAASAALGQVEATSGRQQT